MMTKAIVAEDFKNASEEYRKFQNAIADHFKDDPIMMTLFEKTYKLAESYQKSIADIYANGFTMEEIIEVRGIEQDEESIVTQKQ